MLDAKEDRRVRKTKKALREGLAALLNEKNIQNITVRELTDRVDIHRSTFYANFKDIHDLYSHMEDTVIKEITDILIVDDSFKPKVFFECMLNYINDNKQISRLFFGGNISTAFYERLTAMFKDSCIECWREEYNIPASDELDYYVQYCLAGGLGVIGMWVARNFEYPRDKLVMMLTDIDTGFAEFFFNRDR